MKFSQVNEYQVKQANEALETIRQLKGALAKQRLVNKAFGKYFFEQRPAVVNI